ncbi:hypothetical protein [Tropicibacter naphthalenivorans]|uniref:Uncharacterized protein n=1 Tax=Tropicibacter naphthalenivorans TaxID=441103 RepID=A0A0N7LYW9_9RHOB|nr:hypothetical protein [Tropicibacter naphthalenivorans]CUH76033.1 hypothetical protein TRN7648_00747 [Tropicibacter naphthalenivorans]SMC40425.1 hypothetical protein SAMN04488093_101137 [Tropicibacter naphthalenivorans]
MKTEHIAAAISGTLAAGMVAAVIMMPPLTSPTGQLPEETMTYKTAAAQIDGGDYCRTNLTGVDCGCFAYRTDLVLNSNRIYIQGHSYLDKWTLALIQAKESCS